MMSKKAQIEGWVVVVIIAVIGVVLLIALFASGLLPKAFDAVQGQLKPPS